MPDTLVLTRAQLRQSVDVGLLAAELRQALAGYQEDGVAQRARAPAGPDVTAMILLPGLAPGGPAYTVKVHAKNPARRPALTGAICLHDRATGGLLAILDSGWLTSLRTAVGAAVGTHILARRGCRAVGIIGAGTQGRAQLMALAALRPVTSVLVHDADPAAAAAFARRSPALAAAPARVVASAGAAASAGAVASECDVLLIATWSRTPVLTLDQARPGLHITSLGADEPGKHELDPRLLARAVVITDDRRLAGPVLPRADASLSQVLRGEHPGRQSAEEITVYSPVGLPLQDCVAAWHAYQRARSLGLGTRLTLSPDRRVPAPARTGATIRHQHPDAGVAQSGGFA